MNLSGTRLPFWWTTGGAAYTLTASSGSFVLTGQAVGLTTQRKISSDTGAFTLTGNATGLYRGYPLTAATGSFVLTGQDAGLTAQRKLSESCGAFTVLGNDYSAESNLQALYRFESGALTTDSSGKSNTLTAYSAAAESISDRREGLCAADFELSESDGYYRADADLNADFPLKYGTSNKIFTLCGWTKLESLAHGAHADIVTKTYDGSGLESLRLAWYRWNDEYRIYLTLGRAEAPGYESLLLFTVTSAECIGVYAHIAATYDDSTKAWTARMWDANTNTAASNSGTATNNILLTQARLGIGCASWGSSWNNGIDGILDEVAIFNRVLSTAEIDSIRIQTFGKVTGLTAQRKISSDTGAFTLTGQAVGLTAQRKISSDTGSFILTGQDVTLTLVGVYELAANTGTFSLTGQDVGLLFDRKLSLAVGSFALTGQDISFLRTYAVDASTGTFTLTGQDVGLRADRKLSLSTGTFVLTGQDVGFVYTPAGTYNLLVDTGIFALTGQAVGLRADRLLSLATGTFTLTGQDANLFFGYGFSAATGSFALTGQDVGLRANRTLSLSTGSFVLTGQSISFIYGNTLTASTGTFVLTGQAVTFSVPRQLTASPGTFILTGRSVLFEYSGREICIKYLDSLITDPMLLDSLITEEITLDGDLCR